MASIAFVSREVHPITRGGIGTHVCAAAAALAAEADVTIITQSLNEPRYRELLAARDPALPDGVRFEFVTEPAPDEQGSFYSLMHAYSARVYEKLCELFPNGGPDLVEFPDYLGEGLVTLQARRTLDPRLRNTRAAVRLHTTIEIVRVLNGYVDDELESRALFEAERYSLAGADTVVWPGGDVFGTYQRFYGADAIAEAVRIPNAGGGMATGALPAPDEGPVRLLYLGRLERRKGVEDLVRAATALPRDDWTLTLVGDDSDTASLGGSMRARLEAMAGGDPRVEFGEARPRHELADLYASHHVLICPSRWECWPYTVLDALECGRPAIGTPTGGLVEMLAQPNAGWLAPRRGEDGIAETIERVLDDRGRVDELIGSGAPRREFGRLADSAELRSSYLALVGAESDRRAAASERSEAPLVSVVIPYFRLHRFIGETLESVFAQDYPQLEVIVVNDGSFWSEDGCLAELEARYPLRVLTKANAGLGAARNTGITQSSGRYVLPLDADDTIRQGFIRRAVDVLQADAETAYVASWSQYVDEEGNPWERPDSGYRPIGNSPALTMDENVAGASAAVIRKRVFELGHAYSADLTSFEDWQFYRELHAAGLYGHVIPERLLVYRIRADSMMRDIGLPRRERILGEMNARLIEGRVEWERSATSTTRLESPGLKGSDPYGDGTDTLADLERANRDLWRENARLARARVGSAGSEARVRELEALLATPRHQGVERLRAGIRALPLADRAARWLGRRVS